MKVYFSSLLLFLTVFSVFGQEAEMYFKPLLYRNIGPFRGGRSVTASGVINDPLTYYMGTTGGGLWKTEDAGQHWNNISDGYFKTGSVGAIAVSPSNPNILYCGMGEHAIRGVMTSYGDGVYKSTNAGKTWQKVGLDKTQQISRIVIHPTNPDIVYVAAQGAANGPTKERGVYRSLDGGKTWENVLFINDLSGSAELSMDMNNPLVLYTAMWHNERKPWKVISGGEGSDLYKSTDGGTTWNKIFKGLPEEKGKMAIAVCPSNSNKVYALIESDTQKDLGGLFVSNDAGENWEQVSGDNRLTQRAWYYTEVFLDPNDENVVYVMSASALRSIDGGKTWEVLPDAHGDYHNLWINPNNSKNMVIADDGGAAISFNQGKTWSTQSNMPTGQFYRVNADNDFPYNIYGGQQDNTSVKIASLSLGRGGISKQDWTYSAGGESAFLAFNPDDPKYVVGGSYLGTIEILNMKAKASTNVMAAPIQYLGREARNMKYLYNWNAPIIWSHYEPNTFYHGAQLVLKTSDLGVTWKEVSPDLTRNLDEKQGNGGGPYTNEAVGAENYGTLSYMVESPLEKGVIWTGSDDGLVYLTRDNTKTWQNVTPKGLEETLINSIEVSPHDPATAYIATTRYKFNDKTPALFKTTNYGKSWTNISNGIPYGAYTHVIREDPTNKDILYAGTETGIYISWNGGNSWESFQLNLPVTPITDLKVHHGDLLVATSGRAFWILDNISVLSQYKKMNSGKSKNLLLYAPADAMYGSWGSPLNNNGKDVTGTNEFEGVNPANGVVIYYQLPKLTDSIPVTLSIKNREGKIIRSFSSVADKNYLKYDGGPPADEILSKNEGLNRFVWDMRYSILPGVPNAYIEANYKGHKVSPGTYNLELEANGKTETRKAVILKNPLYRTTEKQYKEYDAIMGEMEQNLTEMHTTINRLKKIENQISDLINFMKINHKNPELISEGEKLRSDIDMWDKEMIQRKAKAYDDVDNFVNKFSAQYLFLINQTEGAIPIVNEPSKERKMELDKQWYSLKSQANEILNNRIPQFNTLLWNAGIGAIPLSKS